MTLESSKGGTNGVTPAGGGGGIIPAEEVVVNNHDAQQPSALTLPYRRPNPYLPSKTYNQRMGLKSQHAVSAIKACKKKSSSSWWSSRSKKLPPKNRKNHDECRVCKAKALNTKIPKRAHHPSCKFNRAFKNKARQEQQEQQKGEDEEPNPPAGGGRAGATARASLTNDSRGQGTIQMNPLVTHPSKIHQSATSWELTMGTMTQNPTTAMAVAAVPVGPETAVFVTNPQHKPVSDHHPLLAPPLGQLLRNELERRLEVLKGSIARVDGMQPTATDEKNALMKRRSKQKHQGAGTDTDGTLTYDQLEAINNRRVYFNDQQCFFTFPPDPSVHPLTEYHFIEGMSIFMLDLEVLLLQTAGQESSTGTTAQNKVMLRCVVCQQHLERQRTNWSKRKTLFPVLEQNGLFSFGSVMSYQCVSCKANYTANHGSLLLQLPPHLRRAYPVEPRFAISGFNFHLSKDVTSNLRGAMLTQGSGDNESKMLYRKSREKFTEAVTTFLSKLPDATNPHQQFPITFKDWCRFPPGGDQLRNYYRQGEQSCDTIYGYSNTDKKGNKARS